MRTPFEPSGDPKNRSKERLLERIEIALGDVDKNFSCDDTSWCSRCDTLRLLSDLKLRVQELES